MSFKSRVKDLTPPFLLRKIIGLFYGWHGSYPSWEEASQLCSCYNSEMILEKVKTATLNVKQGRFPFARDSVNFSKICYSYPLLAAILWVATQKENKVNIMDFGGSLGSSFYQNKLFLESLEDFNWCIVEQHHFVDLGKAQFAEKKLHFFYTIEDCLQTYPINLLILSSVLQYLEDPFRILEEIFRSNIEYVLVDRTTFVLHGKDKLTLQKVPKKIYKANYPCWFFNENKFVNFFLPGYDLIYEFEVDEHINIPSKMKGFLFRKKK